MDLIVLVRKNLIVLVEDFKRSDKLLDLLWSGPDVYLRCFCKFSGRLFDKNGNLNNWWSITSSYGFLTRASCLAKQYSKFKVYGQQVEWRALSKFFTLFGRKKKIAIICTEISNSSNIFPQLVSQQSCVARCGLVLYVLLSPAQQMFLLQKVYSSTSWIYVVRRGGKT